MTEARTQDADIQGKPNAVPHAQVSMKACSNLALPGHATVMANCRVQQFTTLEVSALVRHLNTMEQSSGREC